MRAALTVSIIALSYCVVNSVASAGPTSGAAGAGSGAVRHFQRTLVAVAAQSAAEEAGGDASWASVHATAHDAHGTSPITDLGVVQVELHATVRVAGKEPIPVLLRTWLKLVNPNPTSNDDAKNVTTPHNDNDHVPYRMPHQNRQRTVHGVAWPEDTLSDADTRTSWGHWVMAFNPRAWQPRLLLQTASGAILRSIPDPRLDPYWHDWRAFGFRVELGAEPGDCFKVWEESYPSHRASFCLPPPAPRAHARPTSDAHLCRRLAPPDRYTPQAPALWTHLIPFRSAGVPGERWAAHAADAAARVYNYDLHHEAIGSAGMILYGDHFLLEALRQHPLLRRLARVGRLMLVEWELIERAPMFYNYDQATTFSHVTLGLSGCGTNLMVLLGDVDEYLYSAFGHRWPDMHACLRNGSGAGNVSGGDAGVYRIQRLGAATTILPAAVEPKLWGTPAALLRRHPLLFYNSVNRQPHLVFETKCLVLPAADATSAFVHDLYTLHGDTRIMGGLCAFIVHVINYWRARVAGNDTGYEPYVLRLP